MKKMLLFTSLLLFSTCLFQDEPPQRSKEQIIRDFFLKKTGIDLAQSNNDTRAQFNLNEPVSIPELDIEYYFPYFRTTIGCFYIYDNKSSNQYFKCNANYNYGNINDLRKNEIPDIAGDNVVFDVDSIGYFRERTYPEEAISDYLNDAFLDSLISFEQFKRLLDRYYEHYANGEMTYYDIDDSLNIKELMIFANHESAKLSSQNKIEQNKKDKLLRDVNYLLLPPFTPLETYKLIYCLPGNNRFRVVKLLTHALHETKDGSYLKVDKYYYAMIIQNISLHMDDY